MHDIRRLIKGHFEIRLDYNNPNSVDVGAEFLRAGVSRFNRFRCRQMRPMLGRAPSDVRSARWSLPDHVEARKAELVHQRRLIGGHGAEA